MVLPDVMVRVSEEMRVRSKQKKPFSPEQQQNNLEQQKQFQNIDR